MYYDVKQFGALGDGKHKDTQAIQAAIDKCVAKGGGRVIVPPGVFLTGTLGLEDNVELHIMSGAKLLGSLDQSDYTERYNAPYDTGSKVENAAGAHLITAWKKKNVTLSGTGTIDGNGPSFFGAEIPSFSVPNWEYREKWRPGQMIAFLECQGVRMENLTLQNSTYWTVWPYACREVCITNVKIRNDERTPNGDGINPDCCENVIISNCDIESGDDAIALRANRARSGLVRDLENVTITNCILKTPLNGVRFGPSGEQSKIRNVTVSNCVIREAMAGLLFSLWYRPPNWVQGVLVENVSISNMVINARSPLRMYLKPNTGGSCGFHNIAVRGILATGTNPCLMLGLGDGVFDKILVDDFQLKLTHWNDRSHYEEDAARCAFYVKNVQRVSLRNLRIDVTAPELLPLRHLMHFEQMQGLTLDNPDVITAADQKLKIFMKDVGSLKLQNCEMLDQDTVSIINELEK